MDPQLLHLRLNHLPVVSVLWTLPFLVVALVRPTRTALLRAHAFAVVLALLTTGAYLTGDGAEEKIEHLPGVVESAIEAHQDAALIAFVISLVAGATGLVGLWAARTNRVRMAKTLCWVVTLVVAFETGALFNTAHRGGIVHRPELYQGGTGETEHTPD
jgi:uncharacterized membrane protein YtjA (UPF0391 family)